MKKNENGFGAIEGLLAMILIVLIGFVGWYVWHNRAAKTTTKAPATTTTAATPQQTVATTSPTKPAVDPYADWKTYNNASYGVSFKYPSDWNIDASSISGDLNIKVSQITPAQIQANQSSLSQYNDYMKVWFGVSKTNIGGTGVNGENILESITFNGTKYPLIGDTNAGKVLQVSLMKCSSKTNCTNWVPTSTGGSVDARISSVANQQAATVPIDLSGSQYKTANLILKSLKI